MGVINTSKIMDKQVAKILTGLSSVTSSVHIEKLLACKTESRVVLYIDQQLNKNDDSLITEIQQLRSKLTAKDQKAISSYLEKLLLKYPILDKHTFKILSKLT